MDKKLIISSSSIKDKIHTFRGLQVILDRDLAKLYNIETRALKQAVNRNRKRFPSDFMFILTDKEGRFMRDKKGDLIKRDYGYWFKNL